MPATKIRDSGRVHRLISIAYLLSMKSEMHIGELLERTGVDRKTIEADLNVLMFCGLPPYSPGELFDIYIDEDYVSIMYNDVFLSPLRLSAEERAQTVIALKKLSIEGDKEDRSAIVEVLALLDESQGSHIDIASNDSVSLEIVTQAIDDKYCLEIEYLSLHSASLSTRIIEPIRIFTTASVSYVYAFSRDVQQRRIFRTDRITTIQSLTDVPAENVEDVAGDINIESSTVFSTQTQDYVDFTVSPEATWMLDTFPHEPVDEAKRIFRFYSASPFFAARLLLAHGQFVTYVGGTISRAAIVEALRTLEARMTALVKP